MRKVISVALLFFVVALARALPPDSVLAQGARDGDAPAWAIAVESPAGWTRDCCTYAKAIGVNAVLYQGEWIGKPQRVMVLNVWPSKLASVAAEVHADRKRYAELDPHGKTSSFAVRHPDMPCQASVYEGSDRIDDVLVFCDPGKANGVRLSWSMTLDASDPTRGALLDAFMQVVMTSHYQRYVAPPARGG
ncbi:MAG: hypothetical protein ABI128_11320 [Rhodanobacter sp.]